MSMSGRSLSGWPATGALLALIYVAGVIALQVAPDDRSVASWWPGAGLAVVLLIYTPRRRWPVVALAIAGVSAAATMSVGTDWDLSACLAVANAVSAVIAASVLRGGRKAVPGLRSFEDFIRLLGAAALGAVAAGILSALAVAALDEGFLDALRSVSVSHMSSAMVTVPVALTMRRGPLRQDRREAVLQVLLLAVVTLAVFSPGQDRSLSFAPLPFLVWGALRLDLRVAMWELLAFSSVVTTLVARGYGPYGVDYRIGQLDGDGVGSLVQGYVLAAALLTIPLAITVDRSHRLLQQVTDRERLFRRVFTESPLGMLLLRKVERGLEVVDLNETAARMLGAGGSPIGREIGELLTTSEPLASVAAQIVDGDLPGWSGSTGLVDRPGAEANVTLALVTTEPEPVLAAQLLDMTAEHDARRRLEAAEKLTSATLDTTAAMILVTDLMGVVVRVNGATTALTGFTEEELVGTEIWDVPFAPPGAIGYPAGLPASATEQVSRETDLVTSSGERRRIRWNTGYVHDERFRPTYTVLTGIDFTAERTAAGVNRHLLEAAITTALIGIDPRGLITVFNAGAVNLLGFDAQDTVGTPFVDLIDPVQLSERSLGFTGEDAFMQLVGGIKGGGETAPRDWTWIGADGRRHTVSMTLSIASDTFAARSGYLCVGRDVTESRASQEMLIAALEKERLAVQRMRELDAAKDEFVSTVSHELRTPVSSIVGYTEILEDGSVVAPAPEQLPLLASIARNGQRLIMICDDLLTLSGLDSGATRWERDVVDLTQILAGAEDAVRAHLVGRDLQMIYSATDDPVLVVGDRVQLERVVTNLLSNAIKFTEDGGRIEVAVTIVDGEASVSVRDSGIGIPEEEQANLFQRFFRSSSAQERAIQGTGLGLSIVAAVVATHGGRIDVESAHLKGTTITIRLPLARARG